MMGLDVFHSANVRNYFDRAYGDLPETITDERQVKAWIARRMMELMEASRQYTQSTQVLLALYIANGDDGALWMDHPDGFASFRDFLKSIGKSTGQRLSASIISEIVAVAEVIVPYCDSRGIDARSYVNGPLWNKFREAIPRLAESARSDNPEAIESILESIRELPSRDAVRALYRVSRNDRGARAGAISHNGTTYIVVSCRNGEAAAIKTAISRVSDWLLVPDVTVGGSGMVTIFFRDKEVEDGEETS